jgi:PrtD family type I secretion system ABC transporter
MTRGGSKSGTLASMKAEGWYGLALVVTFSFFLNILILASPIYSMQVFDRVLPSRSQYTLLFLSIFTVIAIVVLAALDILRAQALARIARWWAERTREPVLRASVLATLRGSSPAVHGLQDVGTVRGFIASSAPLPLFDAPWTPVFLAVLALLNPMIGLLAGGTALLLLALAVVNDVATRRAMNGVSEAQMQLANFAHVAIRHADTIQAMGMQGALGRRYGERNGLIQDANQRAADSSAILSGVSKFLRIGVQIAVMGLGAWLVLQNRLTAGGMIASSIILGRALAPVEQAIGAWRNLVAAMEAYRRTRQLLDLADAQEDVIALPSPAGHLGVEQLVYAAPNSDKPIVRGVSFAIEAGSALSVIGPSAAGKSTLCRLLAGSLRPSAGHVRLDRAELYRWDRADIGRHVGYLPQGVELFTGTVKENIARLGHIDDAAVVDAAVLAGCHEMILQLAQGYETNIGEAGTYLSGGQRQRLGLARALYGNPKLIVLDEPDAHLDDLGVHALVEAITKLRARRATVVVVTHRRELIRPTDYMLVLSAGKADLFGRTEEVVRELQRKRDEIDRSSVAGMGARPLRRPASSAQGV